MNLVSAASFADRWRRHYADSVQLARLIPSAACAHVDLGSGAGFPGLVLAAVMADRRGWRTHLVESTQKKARFLEAAAAAMAAPVAVHAERAETMARPPQADVVTARALAPLPKLLSYAARFIAPGGVCLFPKGRDVDTELTEAAKSWMFDAVFHPSHTSTEGVVLELKDLRRV